jgi:hypothetical protein
MQIMNATNAKDYLPPIQAMANGKTIQWFDHFANKWLDSPIIDCDSDVRDYRIKPEPREVYVEITHDGSHGRVATRETRDRFCEVIRFVPFREVL